MNYIGAKRIIFLLIAVNFISWNIFMPVFEPADESGHYAHILYIWKQGRLPDLAELPPTEKGVGYTTYPPLYYWSMIPLAKLASAPLESEELLPYHPQKEFFKESVFSVYLHTKDELLFKWNKLMAAVHLLRLQTSVYGLLTVYLVYLTGKKVFGENSWKPLLAAVLVGLNPMFAHISNSIVNVNLNILLFSLFFYLAVSSLQKSSLVPAKWRGGLDCHGVKRLAMTIISFGKALNLNFVLGAIAGLAYLTKITGLALIPIWLLFILCHSCESKNPRSVPAKAGIYLYRFLIGSGTTSGFRIKSGMRLKSIFAFITGFILAAGWYLARNFNLYGNLLETGVAIKHFGRPAMQLEVSGPVNYWTGFIQTNFKTFFSGYGMVTVNLPDGVLFLLLILLLIGFWGILIRWTANSDCHGSPKASLAMTKREPFLTISAVLILLGHVSVNFSVEAFHARDLFIGMVPFSLLFVDGLSIWLKELRSGKLWSSRTISSLMFLIFLTVALFHFLQPVLVEFVKTILSGFQVSFSVAMKLTSFTIIFYILWLISKKYIGRNPGVIIRISSNKNFLWAIAGGLFTFNILILATLVVPKLYQL